MHHDNLTVTMPLSYYENMKRKAEQNDVKNFIKVKYADIVKNERELVLNREAIEKHFRTTMNFIQFE